MKKILLLSILLLASTSIWAQKKSWGIGLRGGEPSGISIKKYMGKNAWELNVGRTYWGGWSNKYYKNDSYQGNAISIQLHYLFQRPFSGVKGLDWYAGLGGQYVNHTYKYKADKNNWYEYTDTDLGADFVIGLEYNFPDVPFAIAFDTGLFMELYDNAFYSRGTGGLAIRYNF
jgi:hypothetical protein